MQFNGFDVRSFLIACPDGTTFTRDAVLKLLDRYDAIEEGSPGQVARRLGYSAKWWRYAAETDGVREGWAYQDDETGRWRLSLVGARGYIARRKQRSTATGGGKLRGPRKKAARAQAARVGAASVLSRPVGMAGLATVGWREDRSARSVASQLAQVGSEN